MRVGLMRFASAFIALAAGIAKIVVLLAHHGP